MNRLLLILILPTDLLHYFDIVDFEELGGLSVKKDCLHIYLEEKNKLPQGYSSAEYGSKGFSSSKQIQDFSYTRKSSLFAYKNKTLAG